MRFDIDDYKARTERLRWDDLDFDAFRDQPLDDATLRVLGYMHDVEHHTVCYLRDLLVTPAHDDPDITTFLGFWVHEEFWHGEALGDVLAAHGRANGVERVRRVRSALGRRDRLRPLLMSLSSTLAGRSMTAVHMTWGAVNEWTTQAGYARVAQLAGHPVLSELTRRIAKQEGRHIDFYASQAEERLTGDRAAQRLTRAALRHLWKPVGSGVMPPAETAFVVRHLFGDEAGHRVAERIDRRIARLPGLAGTAIIERATGGAAAA